MIPPVFVNVAAHAPATALIGSNPVRCYTFGLGPQKGSQDYALPYVTFQTISGQPSNYLGQLPDSDSMTVQIDCWAETPASARAVADAVRDALEPVGYVVSWRGESKDPDTKNYRISFDVDFIVERS